MYEKLVTSFPSLRPKVACGQLASSSHDFAHEQCEPFCRWFRFPTSTCKHSHMQTPTHADTHKYTLRNLISQILITSKHSTAQKNNVCCNSPKCVCVRAGGGSYRTILYLYTLLLISLECKWTLNIVSALAENWTFRLRVQIDCQWWRPKDCVSIDGITKRLVK